MTLTDLTFARFTTNRIPITAIRPRRLAVGLVSWVLLATGVSLDAGQYFQDFSGCAMGATNCNDGSMLFSSAPGKVACVTNSPYNELQLTALGGTNVQSAFQLPDLDSGAPIYAFSAKWNADLSGQFPAAGNGFSFNFGPLASLNLITNNAQETGFTTGLCFSVQTDAGDNSGFYLFVNTNLVDWDNDDPAYQWGTTNSTRHFWEVDWNYYFGLSVRLDGQTLFANVPTLGFVPQGGDVFAWAARCTTNTEEIRLDNIVVVTGGTLLPLATRGPYFADANLPIDTSHPITNAFDGDPATYWSSSGSIGFAGASLCPPDSVLAFVLTSGDTGAHAPQTWTFQGSTNGGSSWSSCGAGRGFYLNPQESRAWLASNSAPYSAYEINFTSNGNSAKGLHPPGDTTTIGELQYYALNAAGAPPAWMQGAGAPKQFWMCIASSSDGTKMAAAFQGGTIYTSTDSGHTWAAGNAPLKIWSSIASSADGTKLAAAYENSSSGGGIYVSPDSGNTWNPSGALSKKWSCIASSADGLKLAAGVNGGGISVSTNSGSTWTVTTTFNDDWISIASSADGTHLAAAAYGDMIYVSHNSGNSWSPTGPSGQNWISIASSSDGTHLAAVIIGGGIYVSSDSGNNWTQTSAPDEAWNGIASSSDGTILAAVVNGGGIYLSTDAGNTWVQTTAPTEAWFGITSSADGGKLAALVSLGGIYSVDIGPPPLNPKLSGGYPVLSWATTNGGNFTLQTATNLLSPTWQDFTLPVSLNGSRYQVTDVPISGSRFYRLTP